MGYRRATRASRTNELSNSLESVLVDTQAVLPSLVHKIDHHEARLHVDRHIETLVEAHDYSPYYCYMRITWSSKIRAMWWSVAGPMLDSKTGKQIISIAQQDWSSVLRTQNGIEIVTVDHDTSFDLTRICHQRQDGRFGARAPDILLGAKSRRMSD